MSQSTYRPIVFLPCTGLGRVSRGYESFTSELFQSIRNEPKLYPFLLKSRFSSDSQVSYVPSLSRTSPFTKFAARVVGRSAYYLEQYSFFLGMRPAFSRLRPDLIFLSDVDLARLLWKYRRSTNSSFRIAFSNGGPIHPPFDFADHIHQVAPVHMEYALAKGARESSQTLIPYGVSMTPYASVTMDEKRSLRKETDLPADRKILLSVAAINSSHKRIDYLINEISSIPIESRPFLLMLGQLEIESPPIIKLAGQVLRKNDYRFLSVNSSNIKSFYRLADVFSLSSLREGLPRSLIEASSHGLPCVVHNNEMTRFVLGESGFYGDMEMAGSIRTLLPEILYRWSARKAELQAKLVRERFGWEMLSPKYVELLLTILNSSSQCD
jgi:1,2-diacylglycerol 3-alpha-glucosyltransferase